MLPYILANYFTSFTNRVGQLFSRIQGYDSVSVLLELVVIWIIVCVILWFLRGTRGGRMLKGVGLVFVLITLVFAILSGDDEGFERLRFLYANLLTLASLGLVIVFQPEIRRALVRLGETRIFTRGTKQVDPIIEGITIAVAYLSRNKIGAIIAIERESELTSLAEGATILNADISAELLQTIFWPGSALHDLGVIIRKNRIYAAGVQFPMIEGRDINKDLGARHRAAMGLSTDSDCLIIVVSEETGTVSVAERGKLDRGLEKEQLQARLRRELYATFRENREVEQLSEKSDNELPPQGT